MDINEELLNFDTDASLPEDAISFPIYETEYRRSRYEDNSDTFFEPTIRQLACNFDVVCCLVEGNHRRYNRVIWTVIPFHNRLAKERVYSVTYELKGFIREQQEVLASNIDINIMDLVTFEKRRTIIPYHDVLCAVINKKIRSK